VFFIVSSRVPRPSGDGATFSFRLFFHPRLLCTISCFPPGNVKTLITFAPSPAISRPCAHRLCLLLTACQVFFFLQKIPACTKHSIFFRVRVPLSPPQPREPSLTAPPLPAAFVSRKEKGPRVLDVFTPIRFLKTNPRYGSLLDDRFSPPIERVFFAVEASHSDPELPFLRPITFIPLFQNTPWFLSPFL